MKNRINLAGIVIVSILLLAGPTANAEIFTVELPEFTGPLTEKWTTKTESFDFGVSFLQINQVRIQLIGTFTPGTAHGNGIWVPEDEWIDVPGIFEGRMNSGDGWWIMGSTVYESPLVVDERFERALGATWDFLLDGTGEATLTFWWGSPIPEWPYIIVTDPAADISEAYLVVDGVVPEPATILLFGVGTIIFRTF